MDIVDFNNFTHHNCPRCHKEWKTTDYGIVCQGNINYPIVDVINIATPIYNCIEVMPTVKHLTNMVLMIKIYKNYPIKDMDDFLTDSYTVAWYHSYCEITINDDVMNNHPIPEVLPYDITFDQIKLYLTFS